MLDVKTWREATVNCNSEVGSYGLLDVEKKIRVGPLVLLSSLGKFRHDKDFLDNFGETKNRPRVLFKNFFWAQLWAENRLLWQHMIQISAKVLSRGPRNNPASSSKTKTRLREASNSGSCVQDLSRNLIRAGWVSRSATPGGKTISTSRYVGSKLSLGAL